MYAYTNTANYSYAPWAPADDSEAATHTAAAAKSLAVWRQNRIHLLTR